MNNDTVGNGYTAVELVFLQFAGFTFGKSASAYTTPWHGYPGNNTSFLVGGYDTVTGINNVQYSGQFGNGVSATIGHRREQREPVQPHADHQCDRWSATAAPLAPPGCAGGKIGFTAPAARSTPRVGCAYGGTLVPDFVGNIRVDQAWGLFQISGALHDNHAGYFSSANISSNQSFVTRRQPGWCSQLRSSERCLGWCGEALRCRSRTSRRVPAMTSRSKGTWSMGASKYVLGTSSADPSSFDIYNGTKLRHGCRDGLDLLGYANCGTAYVPALRGVVGDPGNGSAADQWLGLPRCVQPQLGSLLVEQLVRRHRRAELQPDGQDAVLQHLLDDAGAPSLVRPRHQRWWYWWRCRFGLRSWLHDLRNRPRHPLDPGQEPDVQCGSSVRLPEDQHVGYDDGYAVVGAAAGRTRPTTMATTATLRSTSAFSATSDPIRPTKVWGRATWTS